jgi:hypothetical protein
MTVVDYTPYAVALLVGIIVVALVLLMWPLLKRAGSDVYMTWEEVRLKTGPTAAEVADQRPYDWSKELRALGRPVAARENVERRAA